MLDAIGITLGAVVTVATVALWGFAVLIYTRFMDPRGPAALLLLTVMTLAAFATATIWWGAFFDALEMNTILTVLWYAGIVIVVSPLSLAYF